MRSWLPKVRQGRKRRGRVRSQAYLAWIRTLPCYVCFRWPTEAAHQGAHGLGQKASDFTAVPLCAACHRTSADSYHASAKTFWHRHGIDVNELIAKLNAAYESQKGVLQLPDTTQLVSMDCIGGQHIETLLAPAVGATNASAAN